MAGGIVLPRPVPRETIRREGVRRGHRGEALEDFCLIVQLLDDHFVEIETKRISRETRANAEKARRKR